METDDNETGFGPKMLACLERERAFVLALMERPTANQAQLAKLAGYGGPNATPVSMRQAGHQVWHRKRVQDAIQEETFKRLRLGGAIGIVGLVKIASDPKAKGHLRACEALADRAGFGAEQKITVDHNHSDMTGKAIEERIRELAERLGLDAAKLLGGNAVPVLELKAEARE